MIKQRMSRALALLLCVMLIITGMPFTQVFAAEIGDGSMADGYVKIEESKKTIAPGVSDKKITMNTPEGDKQNIMFACEIDMSVSTTGIMAGYKDYDGTTWGLQTTTDQAAAAEKETGANIVAAINADYFDMTTGATTGALVMGGTVYSQANDRPYFAILKDGSAVIRDGSVPLDDVQEAVGGWPLIVKDGEFTISPSDGGYDNIPYSRTAIGIKENGNVVTLTTHGRINPLSYGMTMFEMAEVLIGQGCKDVLILDGGGSSTYCAKYEGEDELAVVNNPSDGKERMVSSTLFITSSAKPTGEFDHAVIEPNNEVYTPGTEIAFTAIGVDSSGTAVDMPEGVTWAVADGYESMGTIDSETGVFTANENQGEVVVEMIKDGEVVGSTSVTIAQPDSISFTNAEICLGFSEENDLGLTVKYKGRNVNYKDGDFVWTLTPEDETASAEDMGTFNGNMFTSSEGKSVNGNIRCESVWDGNVYAELYAVIGRLPTVAMDFEDQVDEDGNVIDASTYWLGSDDTVGAITTKTYDRGGKEELSLVNVSDDEEHVRFGSNALKIDYDFTQATGTEGAGVGYTINQTIEGTPTAVGMWVYAPEGTANLWLRIRVNDADGQVQNLNFVPEIDKSISDIIKSGQNWTGDTSLLGGINWEGWHYVEAQLTDTEGNPLKAPFELRTGEVIRVMYVPGTGMGLALPDGTYVGQAERKGSLYIDNVRFVYGANVDDLDAPQAEFININDTVFEDNMNVDTNTVTIKASLYDVESAYMTGLDWDRIHTYIDGKEVAFEQAGELLQISNLGLGNGDHEFKLVICDKFGNKTTETRNFTVKGESGFTTIEAERVTEGDVLLNSTQVYDFVANNGENISSFSADVQMNKLFDESTMTVEFNEQIDGASEYDASTGIMHIEGSVKEEAQFSGETKLASVNCYIPSTTAQGVRYRIGVKNGVYSLKNDSDQITTFSAKEYSSEVKASYSVSADVLTEGNSDGYLYVTDADGNAVSGVELYTEDGTRLGKTGSKGYIKASKLTGEAGTYSVYAVKDGNYSFITKILVQTGVGDEEGYPTQITSVVTEDPSSEKAVTWFSNPDAADQTAIMQIAPTSEYEAKGEAAFTDYEGTSKKHSFSGSSDSSKNGTVLINQVHATGLDYDVEYTYRVGDGNYWSNTSTFTLRKTGTDTNLFIIGDMQSENTANVDQIFNNLKDSGIEFNAGIQTGDLVDSGSVYTNWTAALNVFEKNVGNIEILHAIGNHELEGDSKLTASQSIFNMPDANHYSVQYGNVYVATLSYAFSETQLKEDLEWLIEDAQQSDALWKVVVTHQPAYYTNTAGSNELMHELLPAAAEEAGIDFVFSGHDHSYARTEPLQGGEVSEDGVVYYICGSTGEKSYSISDNKAFHFAALNDDFDAIYLTVNATDEKFTVQAHELDGTVIDEYVKTSDSVCMEEGHKFIYDGSGYLTCDTCSYVKYDTEYTGIVLDHETNREMYLIKGVVQTGWQTYGTDKVYYFDENGLSCEVTKTEDIKTTCTVRGHRTFECADAPEAERTLEIKYAKAPGHEYDENNVCTVCGWEQISLDDCNIKLSKTTWVYKNTKIYPLVTITYEDENGTTKFVRNSDYTLKYENNVECGTATVTITPKTKYYVNLNQNRGTFAKGAKTVTYKIVPASVGTVKYSNVTTDSLTLKWNKSKGADGYQIYRYDVTKKKYVLKKTVKSGSTLSAEITGLYYGSRYTFKVVPYAEVEENGTVVKYKGEATYCYTATKPNKSKITSITAGDNSIKVKWASRKCDGYEILYATNSSFDNAKKITINSSSTTVRTIKNLKSEEKYYVKVRAFKKTKDGKIVYGAYSPWRSKETK